MGQDSEKVGHRAWLAMLAVLVAVAVAIALANLSSEPLTGDYLKETIRKGEFPNLASGWPFIWYWRARIQDPGLQSLMTSRWPVSQYSASRLAANVAVWVFLLVAAAAGSRWVLHRYPPRLGWPRPTTLVSLALLSACTVLANLSCDVSSESVWQERDYGWPLIWYRRVDIFLVVGQYQESRYNAARLGGNLVWILMLAATATAGQWLIRRHGLRFSLRTMLAGVAVVAVVCGWLVAARDRADKQDAFIESLLPRGKISSDWNGIDDHIIYVERRTPKWLSVIGEDRLCRHVVGVRFLTRYHRRRA